METFAILTAAAPDVTAFRRKVTVHGSVYVPSQNHIE